jgi:hypothetical protein
MKNILLLFTLFSIRAGHAQYAPSAGTDGTTAIHKDSSIIINWASSVNQFSPGYLNAASPTNGYADFGNESSATGIAEGNSSDVVSLGDGGSIILAFENPIKNGEGPDFAVFENSFDETFLELAHIEVSTDGIRFVRIPSISLTQTLTQTGSFESTDATKINNLAGKYRQGFGTPFDLNDIIDSTGINLDSINYVKVIDVVGSINSNLGSKDSQGHFINDPYPTAFSSGGFDLDGIGVINENKTVGINPNNIPNQLIAYPNPTNSAFNLTSTMEGEITIYDVTGKLYYSNHIEKDETIEFIDYSTGIYVVHFINNKVQLTKKIIVKQ